MKYMYRSKRFFTMHLRIGRKFVLKHALISFYETKEVHLYKKNESPRSSFRYHQRQRCRIYKRLLSSFIAKDKITRRVTVLRGGKLLLTDFPVQIHFRLLHNFMNK